MELIIFGQRSFYGAKPRNSVRREKELECNGSDKDISSVVSSQNACMNWFFVTECLKTNIILFVRKYQSLFHREISTLLLERSSFEI